LFYEFFGGRLSEKKEFTWIHPTFGTRVAIIFIENASFNGW
jgi:hypothetical protein